ncbi:MAG: hypothetical protein OEQ12_04325 [Nitrosopumilus sp.]|nr:hypothetical protein [Nitrosopumilus sp.]
MTTRLFQLLSIMTLVMVISLGQAMDVFADGKIRLTSGNNTVTITDQDFIGNVTADERPDANNVNGIVQTNQQLGNMDLVLTATSFTKLNSGTVSMVMFDHDIVAASSGASDLLYEFTDTGFIGEALSCKNFGGGTTGGTVNYTVYIDSNNQEFAQTQKLFESNHAGLISIDLVGFITPGSPFSVTVVSDIQHQGAVTTSHDIVVECTSTVAGELLPINTQSLMLGALGMSLTWLVPVVASIGGAAAYITYRKI